MYMRECQSAASASSSFLGHLVDVPLLAFRISLCGVGRSGKEDLNVGIKAVDWVAWVGVRWKGKGRLRVECFVPPRHAQLNRLFGAAITRSPDRHLLEVVDSRADIEGRR